MEIPVLSYIRTVGTHEESVSREWKDRCKPRSCQIGKSVWQGDVVIRIEVKVEKYADLVPRKAAIAYMTPVP